MGRAGHVRAVDSGAPLRSVETGSRTALAWLPVTKLTPPTTSQAVVVDDDLLHHTLSLVRDNRLTAIVAPGGSGKTTLAREATGALDHPVAWLRFHRGDDDPRALAELLTAAVEHAVPGCCDLTVGLVDSVRSRSLEPHQLLGSLINELAEHGSLVLVLEDLHLLDAAPTLDALAWFLEFAPPELRVVATSRRPLPLPLARLRSGAGVGEIGADDLRLDAERGAAILARRGIKADAADLDALLAMSNGWMTGFLLGASAARPGRTHFASQTPAALADYLEEEVLAEETPRAQWLLCAASILAELDPERCAVVTGITDARAILDDLRPRLSIFLTEHAGQLRFHDLLAEHLGHELHRRTSDVERAELHQRAAATAPEPGQRIEHLLAAGDHRAAASELEALAGAPDRRPSMDRQLVDWIEQLDAEERLVRPVLDLVVGEAASNRLDTTTAEEVLLSVIERAEAADDFALHWSALAAAARATHDFERFMPLLAELEADPRFGSLPAPVRVEWSMGSAWGALWFGDTELQRARVEEALRAHRERPDLATAEALALHLGFPMATWPGGAQTLERHHIGALAGFGERSWMVRLGATAQLEALGAIRGTAADRGPLTGAEAGLLRSVPHFAIAQDFARTVRAAATGDHHTLRAVVEPLVETPEGGFGLALTPQLAASYRQQGLVDELRSLQRALDGWPGGPPGRPVVSLARAMVDAELAWAEGRLQDADLQLAAAVDHDAARGPLFRDPGCALALLRHERGRTADAERLLGDRLTHLVEHLGSPGRVAAVGSELVPLLQQMAEHPAAPATRVLELLGESPPPSARRVPSTGQVLTRREVEVLQVLAAGASNTELADQLHVSINTVKTHVKRVLTKLGASSRSEAAAIARRQHLL